MNKDTVKRIYQAYRLFIFPSVVVFSCLILIVFIIFPQTSGLINNFRVEGQLKSKFELLDAKAQALESFDENDLNRKLTLALNVYPSDYDLASVVGILQDIVGRFGFRAVSMQMGGKSSQQSKPESQDFIVRLELTGLKTQFGSLIEGIENSPRIMKVKGIEISSIKADGTVNAALSIDVYFKGLPKSFGTADSPLPVISDDEEAILATLAKLPVAGGSSELLSVPKGKANPFE